MSEDPQQQENNRNPDGTFKEGISGNPGGRPKGSKTLKQYQAEAFLNMSDDEKATFVEEIGNDTRWKMAEGNPAQTTEATVEVILPTPLLEVTRKKDGEERDTM